MKRLMLLVLVTGLIFMVSGSACNQFLCKPTDDQINKANTGYAIAQSILNVAATIGPVAAGAPELAPLVQQVSQAAIPVFKQVIDGYCVTQAEWDNAVQKLADAHSKLVVTKAIGRKAFDPAILQTTWSK